MKLIFGAGNLDRIVEGVEELLPSYRADDGAAYLEHRPTTHPDQLVPEDVAVTLFVNSRANVGTFRSIQQNGPSVNLGQLPCKALDETTPAERKQLAALIAQVASWPRIQASTATKILHKKRPALIPILDNEAIFGAYMNPDWPQQPAKTDSVKNPSKIEDALNWIATDLTREENADTWQQLRAIEPDRTLVQIFDSVWWMYYVGVRRPQPEFIHNSTADGLSAQFS